jgi:DNA-binding transcriptional LysR family regulator
MLNSVHLADVDLNLLVLFDVVLKEQSVARAALALHLSPSAVSHGLGRLRRVFDDPLFLRTPKGVLPSARALELATPIADVLSRITGIVASATPFDPAKATRRFTLGMADATAATLIPGLLARIRHSAPRIDLSLRHLFPNTALEDLDARKSDLAVVALDEVPARFAARVVCEETFVIAARVGHPFLRKPTLKAFSEAGHVLASVSGDSRGFVDDALAKTGLRRRVALVVPNFMLALAALAETELVAALPRSLMDLHGGRFGLAAVDSPIPLPLYSLRAIVTQAALRDRGVDWLFEEVVQSVLANLPHAHERKRRAPRARTDG